MSVVCSNIKCPLCKYDPPSGLENVFILNCKTFEEDFTCAKCGFSQTTEVIERDGNSFWRETYTYPMDETGKVLRPPDDGLIERTTACGVRPESGLRGLKPPP
jgi:hypothetical protein